jgi:uncharacterized membrane protein YfcA
MSLELLLPFLLIVAVAGYVQTVTGFALAMIVMGLVTALGMATVADISVIITLAMLGNCTFALSGALHHVDWHAFRAATLGVLPAVVVGVLLLDYLSAGAAEVLKLLLGMVIISGGMHVMMWPTPRAVRSSDGSFVLSGVLGGVFGGLFGVAGPPLIYQFYRQPLPLVVIRKTLIMLFAITSLSRLLIIGAQGRVTVELLVTGFVALPVVALATMVGRRFPPPFSDTTMRRIVFVLLTAIGASLVAAALWRLGIDQS